MKKKVLIPILLILSLSLQAQFSYVLDNSIPVKVNDVFITQPWTGGLNSAQYNTMDLNDDSKEDLVIYDRVAQKVLTFINSQNTFVYTPEYEVMFPAAIQNWLLLRDYDGDGRKDIFTGDILGIRVFRNISAGDKITWKPFYFYTGNSKSEVLLTKGLSGIINLQMQYDDLPSLSDVDGDGDLDIFCTDFSGSGRVELHLNQSVEKYNIPDSLHFELTTKSWGDFAECDCAEFAFNNKACSGSGGRTQHAGGKTLLAIDANGDNTLDMLLSEAECEHLSLLPNAGSVAQPSITSADFFPSTPASFPLYPAPYFEDVDHDGVRDLIVSSNLFSKSDPAVDFRQSNWFYKNAGTDDTPNFVLQTKSFLQGDMIDVGDNAVPAFADLEGDGDLDMFISTNHFPATITLFRNVGTMSDPSFELFDDDYLNLASKNYSNLRIQFVDLNKDGSQDLVFTATSGVPKLFYLLNAAKGKLDFGSVNITPLEFAFTGLENVYFTDVNSDGEIDILRGRSNGSLEYWRNNGNFSYTLENGQFLGIGANILRSNPTCSTGDLNGDGKPELLLSDHSGRISIINDYKNATTTTDAYSEFVYNPREESYYAPNLGGRIWPTVADLFGTRHAAIVIGTSLGGVRLLRPENQSPSIDEIAIYPNPVEQSGILTIETNESAGVEIFSTKGQLLRSSFAISPNTMNQFSVEGLSAGLYILRFLVGNKTITKRLVVL